MVGSESAGQNAGGESARIDTDEDAEGIVFAVDAHPQELASLVSVLAQAGIRSQGFASAEELLAAFERRGPACVVTELELPGVSGIELQHRLSQSSPHTTFVFLTRNPEVASAVAALRGGALDYLEKFWLGTKVVKRVRNALDESRRRLAVSKSSSVAGETSEPRSEQGGTKRREAKKRRSPPGSASRC